MGSNYNLIRNENIKEYGEGTRHLAFLGRLYTDRTHFIYELLQNAEDAEATKVLFELHNDRIEVKHNGMRLFNEEDVRGVCGVGEGTKVDDLTAIGKFGIGFKSVYAYTNTPSIYSGDEAFKIEHYVRPFGIEKLGMSATWTTWFVFPFDKKEMTHIDICKEISDRLVNLNVRTLLFLRCIEEIGYQIFDGRNGTYLRQSDGNDKIRRITVIGEKCESGKVHEEDEIWLVFSRNFSINNQKIPPVEVAFLIKKNKEEKEEIVGISQSPLVVFFPTDKLTRLGFLIQGPYRTTPARDNIPLHDEDNTRLIKETALLIGDILPILRDKALISVSFLQALPINPSDFGGGLFLPIFNAVKTAFKNQPLLPTDGGHYVRTKQAKLARGAELRELLKEEQLKELFETDEAVAWISGEITYDKTRGLRDYLLNELQVEEIDAEAFARKITKEFIAKQNDDWLVQFYRYVIELKSLWRKSLWKGDEGGPLRKKPIIRIQDGRHLIPESERIYFPPKTGETDLVVVKREILADKDALEFLKNLGVHEIDIVAEIIEQILPKYSQSELKSISQQEYMQHIEKIMCALNIDSQEKRDRLRKALKETPFMRATNLEGHTAYKKPDEIYIKNTELALYFEGCPDVWFLDELEGQEFWKELGAADKVRVKYRGNLQDNVTLENFHSSHRRGLSGFDPECDVDKLETAINRGPTIDRMRMIWNELAIRYKSCIRGIVETSRRQNFFESKKEEVVSHFGFLLRESEWLPDSRGKFHHPSELTLEDLPNDFNKDDFLAQQLGMKSAALRIALRDAGIPPENQKYIELLRNLNDEQRRKFDEFLQHIIKPQFPSKPVADPIRREEKVSEALDSAQDRTYEQKSRSVRTSHPEHDSKTKLKNYYTDDFGKLVCQICNKEMPFKKRNGEYYFEDIECFDKETMEVQGLTKEAPELYLALCPVCAAKYKEYVKRDVNAVKKFLEAIESSGDGLSIPVQLDMPESLTAVRFVEKHLYDIRVILNNKLHKYQVENGQKN